LTKFLGGVGHGPGTNEFSFGDDPHHYPDPGVRSGSLSRSGKNCHNSIKLAFGGGLCSLSTSSLIYSFTVVTELKLNPDHHLVPMGHAGRSTLTTDCNHTLRTLYGYANHQSLLYRQWQFSPQWHGRRGKVRVDSGYAGGPAV